MMEDYPTETVCKAMAGLKRSDFQSPLHDGSVYEKILTGGKSRVGKIDRVNKRVDWVWEDSYIMKLVKRDESVPLAVELMSMGVSPLKEALSWSFLCNDYIANLKEAQDWMRSRIAFLERRDGVSLGTQPLQDIGRFVQIGADMVDMDAIVAAHDASAGSSEKDGV